MIMRQVRMASCLSFRCALGPAVKPPPPLMQRERGLSG